MIRAIFAGPLREVPLTQRISVASDSLIGLLEK